VATVAVADIKRTSRTPDAEAGGHPSRPQ